jgi:hypothetical protein
LILIKIVQRSIFNLNTTFYESNKKLAGIILLWILWKSILLMSFIFLTFFFFFFFNIVVIKIGGLKPVSKSYYYTARDIKYLIYINQIEPTEIEYQCWHIFGVRTILIFGLIIWNSSFDIFIFYNSLKFYHSFYFSLYNNCRIHLL